jgi:tetratricopeptide (TPR) repeat protein
MTPLLLILLAAGPPQNLVMQGNTAMRERRYQEAVQLYQQALASRPDSPEAHYDLGGAFYRLGDYTRALDSFERAARLRRKGPLAAQARYNSGNCLFHQGLGIVHSDPYAALGLLEQALASFQEAQRLESSLADAAHNAGVVKRWLRLIEQQIEQQRARNAAAKGPPQQSAPGPGVEAILRLDKGVRPSGGARTRPQRAEKDW